MRIASCQSFVFPAIVLFAAALSLSGTPSNAQNKDFNLELHANAHGSAADVGLPSYPGATLDKDTDNSSAADLGFAFGDTRFRLIVAKYRTKDSPEKVFDFYRKPLSRYGDVLECNQGKPVGAPTVTRSGLACSEQKDGGVTLTDRSVDSNHHELRVGSLHQFRMVSFDEPDHGFTRFALVYVETPKDSDKDEK